MFLPVKGRNAHTFFILYHVHEEIPALTIVLCYQKHLIHGMADPSHIILLLFNSPEVLQSAATNYIKDIHGVNCSLTNTTLSPKSAIDKCTEFKQNRLRPYFFSEFNASFSVSPTSSTSLSAIKFMKKLIVRLLIRYLWTASCFSWDMFFV